MKKHYLVKIQIEIEDQKSEKIKKHCETFLVSAISYLDAGTKINEHFKNVSFDFKIVSISESKIVEVLE